MSKSAKLTSTCATFFLIISMLAPTLAADYLYPNDFDEESWYKTIDYLEYVDVYAAAHGLRRPPAGAHAYLYMTYVNHLGLQMLYAGLTNITMGLGRFTVTLPIQTFMMHYKTQNESSDVVTASSYIMLLAYNETTNTAFTNSPDKNDTLYASFSIGFDLSPTISVDAPSLNSKTTTIPLSQPSENRWHWGMKYTNLTAIWWRVNIDPEDASHNSTMVAVSVYEELTFTYDLILHPENNTAKIQSNYTIGKMTDLWVVDTWFWFIPVVVHYNNTGCYRLDKSLYSNETIHQFLNKHGISMSIVLFQASVVLDKTTQSTINGQNVTDQEVMVGNETISTFSEDGEKIFDTDFGVKNSYTLHNHTSGSSEPHNVTTRTAHPTGFAKNERNPIFEIHTFLMRYIPLALAHMDRPLYNQARNHLLNMTYADYFYIISYPTYDGYKITHDPTCIAYLTMTESSPGGRLAGLLGLIFIAAAAVTVSGVIVIFVRLKRRSAPVSPSTVQT